jgi:hypothetical protein
MKGLQNENNDFQVNVPGYGTMPLEMLKRHVKELTKDFNDTVQGEEFIKAAYRTEQLYNALFALSKAMKSKSKDLDETHSTGTTAGSAGIGGGAGLGIEKSPMEKVLEKPLGEGNLPPKAGFNKNPHKVGPGTSKDDYEYKKFIPRDRKEKGEEWAIARDVKNVNSRIGKKKPKELDTGFYKNYLSNRPVREEDLEESLPTSPGGMGQSYRKFTPKSAGMAEMDSQGYKGHRGDEDPGKGPEKVVKPAKTKDVAKDAEKELTKAMDKAHKKGVDEEQAPMFTPEEKIANMNDKNSDGWRVVKMKSAGTKESAIMKGLQTEVKGHESPKGK